MAAILIVEDRLTDRQFLTTLLTPAGQKPFTADGLLCKVREALDR